MSFLQTVSQFRQVQTQRGDTLRRIAVRELGDASQWYQLIYINELVYPYITDDPTKAGAGVVLTGQPILIPSASQNRVITDPAVVYGQDVALKDGFLGVNGNGDMAIVSGVDNLTQALANRVHTPPGDLDYHLDYGCAANALVGKKGRASVTALMASFVKRAILQDPRINDIASATVTLNGDVLGASIVAETINGATEGVTI